jgi:hypothetical protein
MAKPPKRDEPPPGMLPSGELNTVKPDDPPYKPRVVPDNESDAEVSAKE